jgi:hypothetical protein
LGDDETTYYLQTINQDSVRSQPSKYAASTRVEAATPYVYGGVAGERPVSATDTEVKNKYENPAGEQLGNAVSAHAEAATPPEGGFRDGEGPLLPASGATNDIEDPAGEQLGNAASAHAGAATPHDVDDSIDFELIVRE